MSVHTKWVSVYGNAMSINERRPEAYAKNITLTYPVLVALDGESIRITLDNYCSDEPVTIQKATVALASQPITGKPSLAYAVEASTIATLSFGPEKSTSVTIPAGITWVSNPVAFKVASGDTLCVKLYLEDYTCMQSAVFVSGPLSKGFYSLGDQTEQAVLPAKQTKTIHHAYFLSNIEMLTAPNNRCLLCYGDSITAQSWPDYLALSLQEKGSHTAVIRRAASGTRVLREYDCITYDWYGLSGKRRFHHELPTPGCEICIIQQGINDIIHPVGSEVNEFRPMSDLPTAAELIEGLSWYVREAKAMGLIVYLGTLLPIGGWRTYAPFREVLRQEVNDWMRTTDLADGCIDFDRAVADPLAPERLLPQYDSGDHLHPSEAGYQAMADCAFTFLNEQNISL